MRFEGRTVHLAGFRECPIGDRNGRRTVAAMHRRARYGHQRERALHRHVSERQQFFCAALGGARLTQRDLGAQQRCCGLDQAELVVELLESRPRLIGQVCCFTEVALPEAQVGEQCLHHSDCPFVAALVRFADDELGQGLGLGEMAFEELDERQETERPADTAAIAELVECVGGMVEPVTCQCHVAGQERDPCPVLLEPRQSAVIVEEAVERVGFSEEPLGVDQRSTEQFDETAGA